MGIDGGSKKMGKFAALLEQGPGNQVQVFFNLKLKREFVMRSTKRTLLNVLFSIFLLLVTANVATGLEVGDKAPDFELSSTKGGKLKLSSLRGKNVLIQFYVLDFTPG